MTIGVVAMDHVHVTVPRGLEAAAKRFYGEILGLPEIPKPVESKGRGGAWYVAGPVQLHLGLEGEGEAPWPASKRHVCLRVADLAAAEAAFRAAGVEILPDERPIAGVRRFYVLDPSQNRLEIAQDR